MRVLISGQAGLAVIVEGDQAFSIDVQDRRRMARAGHEWPYLLSDSNDVYEVKDIPDSEVIKELDLAWRKDRCLHLLLVLLDGEAGDYARTTSASYVEEFLADENIHRHMLNRLHVAPLPASSDLKGALVIVERFGHDKIKVFLKLISEAQESIRHCRQAWDLLTPDLFGSLAAKETFGFKAVEQGLFTEVSSGRELDPTKFCEGDERIVRRWRRELKSIDTATHGRKGTNEPRTTVARTGLFKVRRVLSLPKKRHAAIAAGIAASIIILLFTVRIKPVAAAELVEIRTGQPYVEVIQPSLKSLETELQGGLKGLIRYSSKKQAERFFILGEAHTNAGRLQEAAEAFRQSNSSYGSLAAELNEAVALLNSSRLSEAERVLVAALPRAERSEFAVWKSTVLTNLGHIYRTRGQFDQAERSYSGALEMDRRTGFRRGEAIDLNNLAGLFLDRGNLFKALEGFRNSLSISESLGMESSAANSRVSIAMILAGLWRFPEAEAALRSAMSYYKEQGSPLDQAYHDLASAEYQFARVRNLIHRVVKVMDSEEADKALFFLSRALGLYKTVGNKSGEATALLGIGNVLRLNSSATPTDPVDQYRRALALSQSIGDVPRQARAFQAIGYWNWGNKAFEEALSSLRKALDLSEQMGAYGSQIEILLVMGEVNGRLGRNEEAVSYGNRAVELAVKTGDVFNQAVAYDNFGFFLYMYSHRRSESVAALERAYSLYSELGSPMLRDSTKVLIEIVKQSSHQ